MLSLKASVADRDSLNPDPIQDPAFKVNPDPDLGFLWPKIEKKTAENFCYLFLIKKIAISLSLGLYDGLLSPSHRKSLRPSKETSGTSKNVIYKLFLFLLGHFCPPGSGSELKMRIRIRIQRPLNTDPIRIRNIAQNERGILFFRLKRLISALPYHWNTLQNPLRFR